MSNSTRNRQPAGVPTGGEFAVTARVESGTTLNAGPEWGDVNVHEGARTPWGVADNVERIADGIMFVGTPSHGGYKLSPARNKAIPAALRNASGWYEEDCESHIVRWVHPDADTSDDDFAERGVKNWFPAGYEKATGTVLAPGESDQKDRDTWQAAHAADLVTIGVVSSEDRPDMIEVSASVGGLRTAGARGAERTFLVPRSEYAPGTHSFVVDPARYQEITNPPVAQTATTRYTEIDPMHLTAAGRERLNKDLSRRYRHADGTVQTVNEMIGAGHMSGKCVLVDEGKRSYYLESKETEETSGAFVYKVSKTTWDAFNAPDERTPVQRARQDYQLADHNLERITSGYPDRTAAGREASAKARAQHRAATVAYRAAEAEADAAKGHTS